MMTVRPLRTLAALTAGMAALLLGACQREAKIGIEQAGGDTAFTVTAAGGDPDICVGSLHVTDLDAKPSTAWHVLQTDAAAKAGQCASRFTYGSAPHGYNSPAAAPPLVDGHRYRVSVSGHGVIGQREFIAGASAP